VGKTSFGYRRLEQILKTNCAASAEEITTAMKCDFAAWQGTNARRDEDFWWCLDCDENP